MRKKITIIGTGHVGTATAHWIASKGLGDITLIGRTPGIPQGKALDLQEALPIEGIDIKIIGTNNYEDIKNSDIVIITAGVPRKSEMTRDDLLNINLKVVENISEKIKKYSPQSIILVLTNPLDAIVYKVWKTTGFPKNRIIGMAGILDSSRFATFIAEEVGCSVQDVGAMVLGGHGDTMVALKSQASIGGIALSNFLSNSQINTLIDRTKNGGGEIVKLLKTGSAYMAPGRALAEMVESIVYDQKRILPCSVLCEGEYGAHNIFIGVPIILGESGVEKIIEVDLSKEEKKGMNTTIDHVEKLIKGI